MNPRNDEGTFPKNVFPTDVFPRRIFPWMGGKDDDDERYEYSKTDQHPESENEENK